MEGIDLFLAAMPALGTGMAAFWWINRRSPEPAAPTAVPPPSSTVQAWPAHALPVLDAEKVIATTGTAPALIEVRRMSGLTDATWQTYVVPVIQAVAEMAQQLPASEAHHHAQPGGLWIHTVETLQHAAKLRQGRILPPGADIEVQGRTQHLWTVGIYVAALLHDVGKPVADLRVTLFSRAAPAGAPWQALMGSMLDAKASAYVVDFPRATERDYQAHQRIGVQLMQRLVSTDTRIWLSSEPVLLKHLLGYLGGDVQGPIAEIVREAEAESVRRNLAAGSRVRFAASRATPLIELLMHALRTMLSEGGRLPLNRPGAAGFCDGRDIWFAAARLANEVRDWLKKTCPEEPVPGDTMNDRLFDTWQEYHACVVNPETNGAIWAASIEFAGGQPSIHLGALLRFPLQLLYPAPSLYPAPLDGRIVPVTQSPAAQGPPPASTIPAGNTPCADLPDTDAQCLSAPGTGATNPAAAPPGAAAVSGKTPAQPESPGQDRAPTPTLPGAAASAEPAPVRLPSIQHVGEAMKGARKAARKPAPAAPAPVEHPVPPPPRDDAFLDEDDAAGPMPVMVGRTVASGTPAEPPRFSTAVVPHVALPKDPPPGKKPGKKGGPPSDAALRFMGWVQQGLADGSLPYNTITSLIHFVKVNLRDKEETMMLLVSPAIFRRFAETYGDMATGSEPENEPDISAGKLGMGIQMAFTRAGWHMPAARGRNIHRLQVIRRGDSGGSLLNGFLVVDPERFVNPVPPPNDRLRYWSQNLSAGEKAEK